MLYSKIPLKNLNRSRAHCDSLTLKPKFGKLFYIEFQKNIILEKNVSLFDNKTKESYMKHSECNEQAINHSKNSITKSTVINRLCTVMSFLSWH